jgi:hypothetical protein
MTKLTVRMPISSRVKTKLTVGMAKNRLKMGNFVSQTVISDWKWATLFAGWALPFRKWATLFAGRTYPTGNGQLCLQDRNIQSDMSNFVCSFIFICIKNLALKLIPASSVLIPFSCSPYLYLFQIIGDYCF